MNISRALKSAAFSFIALGIGLTGASCSGSSSIFDGIANVVGQALAPIGDVIDANPIPLGEAVVTLLDFADETVARTARVQEVGRTDADGNYSVEIEAQSVAAIIIDGQTDSGPVRISGLVNPDRSSISKVLNPGTDIACEAGISAINDGTITPDMLDESRVANLEDAAEDFLDANPNINFYDPAAVSAAAQAVRSATDNGAVGAADGAFGEDAETEPPVEETEVLNCETGIFTCEDGTEICSEFVCNDAGDCPDASDENSDICADGVECCVATNSCPSESALDCDDQCCCCNVNEICDPFDSSVGCVQAFARTAPDANSALGRVLKGSKL